MYCILRPLFITFIIAVSGLSTTLFAETASYKAQTTADPEAPVDELELRLRPLMRDEIKVETDAWLTLLGNKATEISEADIAVKYKRKDNSQGEIVGTKRKSRCIGEK